MSVTIVSVSMVIPAADTKLVVEETLDKINLVKQIEKLKKESLERARLIRKLRQQNNSNLKSNHKKNSTNVTANNNLKLFLNENQILSLGVNNKRGFVWSNDTIKKSLRLKFSCGSAGYEELISQHNPLPSLRIIRRKLQNISFHSGILHDVFEMLLIKIACLNDAQKECLLVLDEKYITEGLIYDVSSKSFIGNVTYIA